MKIQTFAPLTSAEVGELAESAFECIDAIYETESAYASAAEQKAQHEVFSFALDTLRYCASAAAGLRAPALLELVARIASFVVDYGDHARPASRGH